MNLDKTVLKNEIKLLEFILIETPEQTYHGVKDVYHV